MRIQELRGKKLALWGLGSEGWSTLKMIRKKFPATQITLLNDKDIKNEMESMLQQDPFLTLVTGDDIKNVINDFDIVIKSPGISSYRPEIEGAKEKGVIFTSATKLWFAEHENAKTICITGTKGKSTTSSLVTHLLRNSDKRVTLGGNFGTPMLDMLEVEPKPDFWVIEMSSYQISDFDDSPYIALLLNLFPEHLDWHKNVENYYKDKVNLFANQKEGQKAIVNKMDPNTQLYLDRIKNPIFFNDENGFHVKDGDIYKGSEKIFLGKDVPIPGNHNLSNICAALTVVEQAGVDYKKCIDAIKTFKGLPHRLYPWGIKDGIIYIDDSISTTPQSAIAALETYKGKEITILLGGFERGLNVDDLAKYLVDNNVNAVITMPDNGNRIFNTIKDQMEGKSSNLKLIESKDLEDAVLKAKKVTNSGGVILLSPGAPSYGRFKNFAERGDSFAKFAGFDLN
ncbi:MAG: UDP-N-acetylmuramoyl-L-alanine--D-glutamate ligase [Candidatus Sericytochromatia bacterium]